MKSLIPSLIGVLALAACAAPPPTTTAQSAVPAQRAAPAMVHTTIAAKDVKWSPAPNMLPPGAQMAVVHGDPSKAEVFVLRLKFPKSREKSKNEPRYKKHPK